MIELSVPNKTLADAFIYLADHKYEIMRRITSKELEQLTDIHPRFKEPTHLAVPVYLDSAKHYPRVLLFNNLGRLYFSNHDCLDQYPLDRPEFYFNYSLPDSERVYASYQVTFSSQSKQTWTATYDYGVIFSEFGLDGQDEFAPFVGCYEVI